MPKRIILIGADEPGLNAVLQFKKINPGASAIVLYPELNPLPEFSCVTLDKFLGNDIDFPENLRAFGIDATLKIVKVRDNISGNESSLPYDALIFASGSAPAQLDVPGTFLNGIARVGDYEEAARLKAKDGVNLVIGNGTNLLMAVSSLLKTGKGTVKVIPCGCNATTIPLGMTLNTMVRTHLSSLGVEFLLDEKLQSLEGTGRVTRVITNKQTLEVSQVINAAPNTPVTYLAEDAGIDLDNEGHIIVNDTLRTNIESIFACGSCASFVSPSCERPISGVSIMATEPRQANSLAATLDERTLRFHAPIVAYSIHFEDLTIAGAGLTLEAASACGFEAMSAMAIQFDRAHFMPESELMTLELIFDAKSARVLGIQGLGKSGDALSGRISAVSALLASHPTVEDIANLEIAYSPPFASAMDILNTVGNVADNILAGSYDGIGAHEFEHLWNNRESNECYFLDCREIGNAEPFLDKYPLHWNHIPQGEIARRISEVPTDKKIILICNTGVRAYEAQITLKAAGLTDVVNVDGGMTAVKKTGVSM